MFRYRSKSKQKSKYNAKKTTTTHGTFDSKLESKFYEYFVKSENVEILELQPKFLLQPKFKYQNKAIREINYIADFKIKIDNKIYIVDSKGFETADFKIKLKMFKYLFPEENIIITKSEKDFENQIYGS